MTDKARLEALFTDWGIVMEHDRWESKEREYPSAPPAGSGPSITVTGGDGPKQYGYSEFFATFCFDDNGNFVYMGVWE